MEGDSEDNTGELSKWSMYIYHHLGLQDHYLDHNLPSRSKYVLKSSIALRSPTADLGKLQPIPLEILQSIISRLDLRTLTSLACVNRHAYEVVVSVPEVKAIVEHAHTALAGALAIRTGKWITCSLLYRTLCTALCEECGEAGGLLYLLTCKRVCWICLSSKQSLLPVSYQAAGYRFGIDRRTIGSLPHMKVVPGIYASSASTLDDAFSLVDAASAFNAGTARHRLMEAMTDHEETNPREFRYPSRPRIVQESLDRKGSNPLRFVAVVEAPWLNPDTNRPDWGFYCKGCRYSAYKTGNHRRRKFITSTFQRHLEECSGIRQGKHLL